MAKELTVLKQVQEFECNFDEVKKWLADEIKKYANLIVNEDNLSDMEKTAREIASMRVSITKKQTEVNAKFDAPKKLFGSKVKELLELVESAERPIKDQIDKYEVIRRDGRRNHCQWLISTTSTELGLTEPYMARIGVDDKWLLRGATEKEVIEAIQMRVCAVLEVQRADTEAAAFKAQKIEMAKFMCESLSVGLATPLLFTEIENRIESLDIGALREHITAEVQKRRDREEKAAQLAVERAERERLAAEEKAERERQAVIDRENRLAAEVEKAKQVESQAQINPDRWVEPPKPVQLFNVTLSLEKVTQEDIDAVFELLKSRSIRGKKLIKAAE